MIPASFVLSISPDEMDRCELLSFIYLFFEERMSVFVCCLTFLFLFSLSLRFYSTSFLPKLFAATENNYAPSNAMLLTLVTRTGKTLFRINLLSEHLLYFIYLFLRGKKKRSCWDHLVCRILFFHVKYISCSEASVSAITEEIDLWLQIFTVAPSPSS